MYIEAFMELISFINSSDHDLAVKVTSVADTYIKGKVAKQKFSPAPDVRSVKENLKAQEAEEKGEAQNEETAIPENEKHATANSISVTPENEEIVAHPINLHQNEEEIEVAPAILHQNEIEIGSHPTVLQQNEDVGSHRAGEEKSVAAIVADLAKKYRDLSARENNTANRASPPQTHTHTHTPPPFEPYEFEPKTRALADGIYVVPTRNGHRGW